MGSILGGGGAKAPTLTVPRIDAGGLSTRVDMDEYTTGVEVMQSAERKALIDRLPQAYKGAATSVRGFIPQFDAAFGAGIEDINALLPMVEPGFGRLTEAGVEAINNNRNAAIGDINQNLSNRRVLGSSFGQNQIAQTAQGFADQEEQFRAQSFLEELELTNQLETQRLNLELDNLNTQLNSTLKAFELDAQGEQVQLDEMNLMTEIALGMVGSATSIINQNRTMSAQAKASSSSGLASLAGSAFSMLSGPIGGALTSGISSMFSGTSELSQGALSLAEGGSLFDSSAFY